LIELQQYGETHFAHSGQVPVFTLPKLALIVQLPPLLLPPLLLPLAPLLLPPELLPLLPPLDDDEPELFELLHAVMALTDAHPEATIAVTARLILASCFMARSP
jgi:hypothetical protein